MHEEISIKTTSLLEFIRKVTDTFPNITITGEWDDAQRYFKLVMKVFPTGLIEGKPFTVFTTSTWLEVELIDYFNINDIYRVAENVLRELFHGYINILTSVPDDRHIDVPAFNLEALAKLNIDFCDPTPMKMYSSRTVQKLASITIKAVGQEALLRRKVEELEEAIRKHDKIQQARFNNAKDDF